MTPSFKPLVRHIQVLLNPLLGKVLGEVISGVFKSAAFFDLQLAIGNLLLYPELVDFYVPHLSHSTSCGNSLCRGCVSLDPDLQVDAYLLQHAANAYALRSTSDQAVVLRLSGGEGYYSLG